MTVCCPVRRHSGLLLFALAGAAGLPAAAIAVPPPNDLCTGAEVIPAAGPFPYLTAITDITDATLTGEPAAPFCQTSVSRGVWYVFSPAAGGSYTIASCSNAPTATTVDDNVMAVYSSTNGCAGPLTLVACNNGATGCSAANTMSTITTSLTVGTTYYVVMWKTGAAAPAAGHGSIQLRIAAPPANDTCANAPPLSLDHPIAGTTQLATNNYQLSAAACFSGPGNSSTSATGRDVAYTFTAPDADTYSFRATGYTTAASQNLVLYVAGACPAGTPPVTVTTCLSAANRTSTGTAEEVTCLSLSAGQMVFVFVDESANTVGSAFTVEVNRCHREAEPNDTPATANTLVYGIEGAIAPAAEADFFSLGLPAAGSRVFALVDGVASNNNGDFDLRVTTATDTLEYDDANNDAAFASLGPNTAGTILAGAPAFLRISAFSVAQQSQPYRLYSIVQPPIASASAEVEPNDTLDQANSFLNGYVSASLATPAPSTDVDLYRFQAASGDLIFLSVDADPLRNLTPINPALALLDGAGTVLLSVDDTANTSSTATSPGVLTATSPNSPGEALVYRVTTTGTYYARVMRSPLQASGAPSAGDYLLSMYVTCFAIADLNHDGRTDGDDIQSFVDCLLTMPVVNCLCADLNGNGVVDLPDVASFVALLTAP